MLPQQLDMLAKQDALLNPEPQPHLPLRMPLCSYDVRCFLLMHWRQLLLLLLAIAGWSARLRHYSCWHAPGLLRSRMQRMLLWGRCCRCMRNDACCF
jgi:hypothetical protein